MITAAVRKYQADKFMYLHSAVCMQTTVSHNTKSFMNERQMILVMMVVCMWPQIKWGLFWHQEVERTMSRTRIVFVNCSSIYYVKERLQWSVPILPPTIHIMSWPPLSEVQNKAKRATIAYHLKHPKECQQPSRGGKFEGTSWKLSTKRVV